MHNNFYVRDDSLCRSENNKGLNIALIIGIHMPSNSPESSTFPSLTLSQKWGLLIPAIDPKS